MSTGPVVLEVDARTVERDETLSRWVASLRDAADCFIFLCGGAGGMSDGDVARLAALFAALPALVQGGTRIGVGDGGTDAGIMRAAGLARFADSATFPLVGVAPAEAISATGASGTVAVDPHHSHIVAVSHLAGKGGDDSSRAAARPLWGLELDIMLGLFTKIAAGRPAVTIAANGAERALDELFAYLDAGRPAILLEGTGRATDAVVAVLRDLPATDAGTRELVPSVVGRGLTERRRQLLHVLPVSSGPAALAALIEDLFAQQRPPSV